jgi:hypothetical protein
MPGFWQNKPEAARHVAPGGGHSGKTNPGSGSRFAGARHAWPLPTARDSILAKRTRGSRCPNSGQNEPEERDILHESPVRAEAAK